MKDLFLNCIDFTEKDGWYTLRRFTDKQYAAFRNESDAARIRSLASSSCILAFHSSAKKISIEYRLGERARDWASFDLVIDGILTETVEVTSPSGVVGFDLPGEECKEIHIYLPHLICVDIKAPEADAPLLPIQKKRKLWLALGDSITQGMVAIRPSSAYPSGVSEFYGCEVINQGVGGIKFESSELDFIGREPDLITVALGCNDWGSCPIPMLKSKVNEYMKKLLSLYRTKEIYAILPIWRSDDVCESKELTFSEHIELLRSVIMEYPRVKIIDGYRLLPHTTAIYNDPSVGQIHPNDEGFLLYSLALSRHLPKNVLN